MRVIFCKCKKLQIITLNNDWFKGFIAICRAIGNWHWDHKMYSSKHLSRVSSRPSSLSSSLRKTSSGLFCLPPRKPHEPSKKGGNGFQKRRPQRHFYSLGQFRRLLSGDLKISLAWRELFWSEREIEGSVYKWLSVSQNQQGNLVSPATSRQAPSSVYLGLLLSDFPVWRLKSLGAVDEVCPKMKADVVGNWHTRSRRRHQTVDISRCLLQNELFGDLKNAKNATVWLSFWGQ